MTKDEALKLALAVLEKHKVLGTTYPPDHKAITAIKEALAQPEQEQLMSDQINYGMSVTQGGKRIDPMSIYKEPEQEPVAAECKFDTETSWGRCSIEHHNWVQSEPEKWPKYQTRLLYTIPPQRKPLTDEEIKAMYIEKNWYEMAHAFTWGAAEVVARAIEAAVWEKQK